MHHGQFRSSHAAFLSCVQQMMPPDVVQIECLAVYVLANSEKVMQTCDAESGLSML